MKISSVLILLGYFGAAYSANILFYGAVGTVSTRISIWPLVEALADKGHQITFLSAIKPDNIKNNSNIKTHEPKKLSEAFVPWDDSMNSYEVRKDRTGFWTDFPSYGIGACKLLYDDEDFVKWIKSRTFDLVIVEGTGVNECAYGMIHYWGAKFILLSTSTVMPWYVDVYGLPDESSSITDMVAGYTKGSEMSFKERFISGLMAVWMMQMREWNYFPELDEIVTNGLGSELKDFPGTREMLRKTNLVLITSHYSLDDPRSFPPNIIPIGGIVVLKEKEPFPDEMERFINSGDGFIYISFGTVTDFTHFDRNVQEEFINALIKFPEMKFIWKMGKKVEGLRIPENAFVTKWAPQQAILGHDKIKAFVTHSGMGGTVEAVHFGVPMVCIPIMFDQDIIADFVVKKGGGVKVEILDMKEEMLVHALNEILYNKKYQDGMKRLNKVFHDRPVPPLESGLWWVEYVLRNDNTNDYMIPPSVNQSWWKRRQIDVWLSVAILFLTVLFMTVFVLKTIVKLIVYALVAKWDEKQNKKLKTK